MHLPVAGGGGFWVVLREPQVYTAVGDAQMVQLRTKAKRPRKDQAKYNRRILTAEGGRFKETKKETDYLRRFLKETKEGEVTAASSPKVTVFSRPRPGILYFEITDKTGATYTFKERSSGLRYFLSYYIQAKALEMTSRGKNAIILMDEPDSFLSIIGQRNLLGRGRENAVTFGLEAAVTSPSFVSFKSVRK